MEYNTPTPTSLSSSIDHGTAERYTIWYIKLIGMRGGILLTLVHGIGISTQSESDSARVRYEGFCGNQCN